MAAIGKIRSWGPTLVLVIGLALFAFIAEELFRSCQATSNEQRQQVGIVLGEKISVQDFQALVEEYQEVLKFTQGRDNFSEEELNQIKDQVWNEYVQNTIIAKECEKIGLTVTDEEMQDLLKMGTNPILRNTPFVNQQTQRFDVTILSKFLNEYNSLQSQGSQIPDNYKAIYSYWRYMEKYLRNQTLVMKYQNLLAGCLLSNPVSAEAAYNDQTQESSIVLAAMPYTDINDNDVKVEDADLKAKYNEQKEMYKQEVETRDIKYVSFQVLPSDADRAALMATMQEAQKSLQDGVATEQVIRKAQSQVAYTGMAVTRAALPTDIAAKVDSMAVGQTSTVFETRSDNTLNVVKLLSKSQMPDSVEYRMISVGGATIEAARATADSIYQALKGGAVFDSIAAKYGQNGSKMWLTSEQYQSSPVIDADSKTLISTINTLGVNELKNLELSQANIILQVTARKAMVDKYDVAIVKHTIDFSKETYSKAYNDFSQYVSESTTIEALEQNASKFGYRVLDRADVASYEHNIAGVRGTRDAMKWIFDASEKEISPLYECGNNDNLLVVALTKVHPVGYRDMESLKEELTQEVMSDKKFEAIAAKYAAAKSIDEAKGMGAKVDTVSQITFSAPVYVQLTNASEPALNGAVAATEKGAFSKKLVKGNRGAYLFQVLDKKDREGAKFDAKNQEQTLKQRNLQAAGRFMNELYQNAKVIDNRYIFF